MNRLNKLKLCIRNFIPKSAMILGIGTAVSAVFTVALTPILADFYTVSDFGIYVLYTSGVNIVSQIICLKFEYQITASKDKQEAFQLIYLSFIVSVTIVFIILAFAAILGKKQFAYIALGSFLAGINTLLINSAIYFEKIKTAAIGSALKGALMPVVQILMAKSSVGLLLGNIISITLIDSFLIIMILREAVKVPLYSIATCAKKYKGYPLFMLAGSLSSALMANQQGYYINYIGTKQSAGYYSMAERILSMPVSVVSAAFSQILIKKASLEYKTNKRIDIIKNASFKLWLISIMIFGCVFLLSDIIINIFLGNEWKNSVNIIRIMVPMFAVRMAVVPLTAVMPTLGKQKETMLWQFTMLALSFSSAMISLNYGLGYMIYIAINSLFLGVGYLGFYIYTLIYIGKLNKGGTK